MGNARGVVKMLNNVHLIGRHAMASALTNASHSNVRIANSDSAVTQSLMEIVKWTATAPTRTGHVWDGNVLTCALIKSVSRMKDASKEPVPQFLKSIIDQT